MTRLLPIVLAAALGLVGCSATGGEVAACRAVCSGHGGIRHIEPSVRGSRCRCLKDRVEAVVLSADAPEFE